MFLNKKPNPIVIKPRVSISPSDMAANDVFLVLVTFVEHVQNVIITAAKRCTSWKKFQLCRSKLNDGEKTNSKIDRVNSKALVICPCVVISVTKPKTIVMVK